MVVGLSGVGKTSLLRAIRLNKTCKSYSSSAVLKKLERPLYNLTQEDFLENQRVLKYFLREVDRDGSAKILDGHLIIETKNRVFKIPEAWFRGLNICQIICITSMPSKIAKRRQEKRFLTGDIKKITHAQRIEVSRAKLLGKKFCIPVSIMESTARANFRNCVKNYIAQNFDR